MDLITPVGDGLIVRFGRFNAPIGAEYNMGSTDKAANTIGGGDAEWTGGLVTVNYTVNDWFGVTARADYFDDHNGARTDVLFGHMIISYTGALLFTITDGAGALIEVRHDTGDELFFVDGDGVAVDSNTSAAVEFIYTF